MGFAAGYAACLLVALGLVPLGCGTSAASKAAPVRAVYPSSSIDGLSLMTMPMPIHVNSQISADGLALKIYASSPGKPKAQPIREGDLDVLMFDGIVNAFPSGTATCRHLWTFSARQLETLQSSTTVGTAYDFALSWGNDVPIGNQITLFARYRPPQGRPVVSAPSYLALK
jgi:hypothetical protein